MNTMNQTVYGELEQRRQLQGTSLQGPLIAASELPSGFITPAEVIALFSEFHIVISGFYDGVEMAFDSEDEANQLGAKELSFTVIGRWQPTPDVNPDHDIAIFTSAKSAQAYVKVLEDCLLVHENRVLIYVRDSTSPVGDFQESLEDGECRRCDELSPLVKSHIEANKQQELIAIINAISLDAEIEHFVVRPDSSIESLDEFLNRSCFYTI